MLKSCLTKNCFSCPPAGESFCITCTAAMRPHANTVTARTAVHDILATATPPKPVENRHGRRASDKREGEDSGGDVDYYRVFIEDPKRPDVEPYMAECEDIIEHLGMDFAEGCAFKAIWRKAAQRTLGYMKRGADAHGVRDSEKVQYYGARQVAIANRRRKKANAPLDVAVTADIKPDGIIVGFGIPVDNKGGKPV